MGVNCHLGGHCRSPGELEFKRLKKIWKLQRAAAIIMSVFICQSLGQERECVESSGVMCLVKGLVLEAMVGAREMHWDSSARLLVAPLRTAGAGEGTAQKVRGTAGHKLWPSAEGCRQATAPCRNKHLPVHPSSSTWQCSSPALPNWGGGC